MKDVVIVSACRTAIGKYGGAFKDVPAVDLGAVVIEEAIKRAGIAKDAVDEVVMGNVLQSGLGQNPARQAMIKAGMPVETPAMTINKVCGSGLRCVSLAAQIIKAGDADVIVAGGMENMSQAPYLVQKARWGYRMGDGKLVDEMIKDGLWDAFVPVVIHGKKGDIVVDTDEFPREGVTAEGLGKLKPAFKRDGGTVTAGNASGINDGAAAFVVMSADKAKELGIKPLATIKSYASAGVDPAIMGTGPVPSSRKALEKAGLTGADMDLVEANEAFAAQAAYCCKELGFDMSKVNIHGGAIALGHPIGASGARILVTLLYGLKEKKAKYGLATLCIGGGQGTACIVENNQ